MNTELLLKVADAIEKYPELYDQETYGDVEVDDTSCGTTACIAGWACALEGYHPVVDRLPWRDASSYFTYTRVAQKPWQAWSNGVSPHDIAQELIGLEDWAAEELFGSDWGPVEGLTVPQALRKIANGTPIDEVTG